GSERGGRTRDEHLFPRPGRQPYRVHLISALTMPSCAFCEIVRGAPHQEVYRDDVVLAFLDRAPLAPGHTLVITLEHIETLEDLPSSLIGPFFGLAQRLSRAFGQAM